MAGFVAKEYGKSWIFEGPAEGPAEFAAYIYTLVELTTINDYLQIPAIDHILSALNFLHREGRLTNKKPGLTEIINVFQIRVHDLGEVVRFGDPIEVRKSRIGVDTGFDIPKSRITAFGQGDYERGLTRIVNYLTGVYQEQGTIARANVNNDSATKKLVTEAQKARRTAETQEEERQARLKAETKTANKNAIDNLFKKIVASEK